MPKIAIIGTTSWGITLGIVLARNGLQVSLWARTEQEAVQLVKAGPNPTLANGISFPPKLSITSSLSEALIKAKAVILAVPSQRVRQNTKLVAEHVDESMLIVSAAKGLEIGSGKPTFCVFTNTDVIGVELGSALKNIIALGAGITDGLGYGDNAKAALITRGLTEITALGVALGANPLTFSGLAGIGDLIATCASPLSRNHYVGVELAKGRSLKEITDSMTGVAEGVSTTLAVWNLAQQMGLEMPITETIYRILYDGADLRQSAAELMQAGAAHELAGRKWKLFSTLRSRRPS